MRVIFVLKNALRDMKYEFMRKWYLGFEKIDATSDLFQFCFLTDFLRGKNQKKFTKASVNKMTLKTL